MGPGRSENECDNEELISEFENACRGGDYEFAPEYREELLQRLETAHNAIEEMASQMLVLEGKLLKAQEEVGTLGHLIDNYKIMTSKIVYEESDGKGPAKLLFEKDGVPHEYIRQRRVTAIYDAEGGGIVFIVAADDSHGEGKK